MAITDIQIDNAVPSSGTPSRALTNALLKLLRDGNFSGVYSDLTGKPTLGTGSALNVAVSGNAASGELVKGNDTRVTGATGGPGSSTDNTIPRFDGTTGKQLQGSGIIVSDTDQISGYRGNINRQTGTTYTLAPSDSGKIVTLSNASAISLIADPNLPEGFNCAIVQRGAGVVTTSTTGAGAIYNRQTQFKTAGLYAMCTLFVDSNSAGNNAVIIFGGDTVA